MKKFLKLIRQYGGIIGTTAGLLGFAMGGTALYFSLSSKAMFDDKAETYISGFVKEHADQLKGETGETGQQGPIGLQGSTGPKGATGATGLQGPIGARGASGATYSPPSGMLCTDFLGNVTRCGSFITLGKLSTDVLCSSYSKAVTKCGSFSTIGTLN